MENGTQAKKKGRALSTHIVSLGVVIIDFYLENGLRTGLNAAFYDAMDSLLLRGFRRVNGNTKTKVKWRRGKLVGQKPRRR